MWWGFINSNNYCMVSAENLHEYRVSTLHPGKIGVWCGMSRRRIVVPIFFTSTITGDVYLDIIPQFVSQLEKSERLSWLQQGNARPHVSMNTVSFLRKFFNERLIYTNLWPPCSPDLSSLDFFLWGFLKNRIYTTALRNLEELIGNIARMIKNIDQKL